MQRRVKRADHHRKAIHALKQAGEIRPLHRQQFQQRLFAALLIARQNHRLHQRDAVFGEEHMLCAAQPDAFRTELTGHLGIARDVRVCAHAKRATELIGPRHELS